MDQVSALNYDDGTNHLIQFYEKYLQFFMTCPAYSLPPYVLRNVAVKLHATLYFESDWQEYASKMGIYDNLHLATIQESAKMAKELPLYITMKAALQHINGNLANIIKALLDTKRYDILFYLKPYIQELMKRSTKNTSDTEIKRFVTVEKQLPCIRSNTNLPLETCKEMNNETVCSVNSNNRNKPEKVCTIELDPLLLSKYTTCELNILQKNSEYSNPVSDKQLSKNLEKLELSPNLSECSCKENSLQEIVLPSAPSEERLSVLIQHTECDIEIARQLSIKMKEEGIAVTTLYDLDKLIIMDFDGALNTVLKEVDFIVPIVSRKFLEQIHPQIYDKYLESSDAMNNRTLYQLMMTEYRNNRCVNVRVRPVLVPDMNRRLLNNNVILSYSYRLWEDFPKLIRVLKGTKRLISQSPFT